MYKMNGNGEHQKKNGKRFRYWFCKCECGKELWIVSGSIISGHTVSCGCFGQKNVSRYANETLYPKRHGLSNKHALPIYSKWIVLLQKCYSPNHSSYKSFGAKGYTVCEEWKNNFKSFHDWYIEKSSDSSLSISIKQNEKIFSPKNCCLKPLKQCQNEIREVAHLDKYGIEYMGEKHLLSTWAEKYGISKRALKRRFLECHDIGKCIKGEWNDGTGCQQRRLDIKDETIRSMYEEGMTIEEIQNELGFSSAMFRLLKMGVKLRPSKKRSSIAKEKEIIKLIEDGKTLLQIQELCPFSSIGNLKRKIEEMGYLVNEKKPKNKTKLD